MLPSLAQHRSPALLGLLSARGSRQGQPLPWVELVIQDLQFMFVHTVCWAMESPKQGLYLFSLAVLVRVCFYGLLRPGEALNLRARDIG